VIANDFMSRIFISNHWKRYERIAEKILSTSEYHYWLNQGRKKEELAKYWVAKEATYKLTHALGFQKRHFAPKSMNCMLDESGNIKIHHGNASYFGKLQLSERGVLAWVSRESQNVDVQHLWVPFKAGNKQEARKKLNAQWIRNAQTPDTLPGILGRDLLKSISSRDLACRTYSSPWAVLTAVTNPAQVFLKYSYLLSTTFFPREKS